jgi:hypothetical protein
MTIRRLDKNEWLPFFDALSKLFAPQVAEVEVASLNLGDQTQAEWLPLVGIAYDPHDDVLEIALDGVDHMIRKPREIYLDDGAAGLMSIEIVDAEDVRQIVKLKEQLMLSAPQV